MKLDAKSYKLQWDVFITRRIACAAVSREAEKSSLFQHLNIGVSRGDRFATERTIPKWQKKRNSRSKLLDVRRNPREKKKFHEFLTNGAFSRNENVINRERYVYLSSRFRRTSRTQNIPDGILRDEIRDRQWYSLDRHILYFYWYFWLKRSKTFVLRAAEFQFSS